MTDRIERDVVLPLSLWELWEVVTDPDLLAGWLADEVRLEPSVGGEAWFRLAEETRTGWVEEISPPTVGPEAGSVAARLTFWWSAPDEPASRVELTLTPLDEETTQLRVVETRPLEVLDLVGIPLPGNGGQSSYGPALLARV